MWYVVAYTLGALSPLAAVVLWELYSQRYPPKQRKYPANRNGTGCNAYDRKSQQYKGEH